MENRLWTRAAIGRNTPTRVCIRCNTLYPTHLGQFDEDGVCGVCYREYLPEIQYDKEACKRIGKKIVEIIKNAST